MVKTACLNMLSQPAPSTPINDDELDTIPED